MSQQPHSSYPPSDQNHYGYPMPTQQNPQSPQPNVLGIIALACAIVGTILACIPGIMILGWILLSAAFIMGIIALCLRGKVKWPGITAIIVSVLGCIIAFIVFFVMVADAVNDVINESSSSPTASASSTLADNSSDEESGDVPTAAGTVRFGETTRWDDGLEAFIGEPQEFAPSEYAAVEGEGEARRFTVTVKNGTDEPIDAFAITTTVQSGGKQGESIFDSKQGISMPSGKIQPGKELSFDIAYQVADPQDVSLDLTIIDYENFQNHEATFIS